MAESLVGASLDSDAFDRGDRRNLAFLPYVPLLKIFSYLNVKDRMRCSYVCKAWWNTALSPPLWSVVYPAQWACGHWEDDPSAHAYLEEKMLQEKRFSRRRLKLYYPKLHGIVDELLPRYFNSEELETFKGVLQEYEEEYTVMSGFITYLLPYVGMGIQKCVLAMSCITRDGILNIILLSCPNLTHLDLSFTSVGDDAFYGLWEYNACINLQHLNFTCCYNLTDKAIANLVKCWTYKEEASDSSSSTVQTVALPGIECDVKQAYKELIDGGVQMGDDQQFHSTGWLGSIVRHSPNCRKCERILVSCSKRNTRQLAGIRYLNLSGCIRLTDQSLYSLITCKEALKNLQFLDVSGNGLFTSKGLSDLVKWCPSLKAENLYYCESLVNGPFKFTANGCSNLQSSRPCCIPLE